MKKLVSKTATIAMSALLTLTLTTSCGGSKTATGGGMKMIEMPCHGTEFQSDKEHFRFSDFAESTDYSLAKDKAYNRVKTGLAGMISTKVKAMTDNYVKNYVQDGGEEVKNRYESISRQVINQQLNGLRVICEKAGEIDGKYRYFICMELTGDDILNDLAKKISDDSKLRTDFEYEKFKNEFSKEMENFQ